jgi:hypothetical protein
MVNNLKYLKLNNIYFILNKLALNLYKF